MPWRGSLVPVPEKAIADAKERGDPEDQLFVLWARERNARVLHKMMRLGNIDMRKRKELWRKIRAIRAARIKLEQAAITQIKIPDWRQGWRADKAKAAESRDK